MAIFVSSVHGEFVIDLPGSVHVLEGKPLGRLNDLVVDKKGAVYFTAGGAYYVKSGGQVTSLGDNIRANGIMLSPDEKTLYVTNGGTILAFDIQPDGAVNNRRRVGNLSGKFYRPLHRRRSQY